METNQWIVPKVLNDCEIFYAQMVNRECGEFVIAFMQDNGLFGTAIYKSGLEYWFNGHYDLETDLDAYCDAMDRARHWVDNFLEEKRRGSDGENLKVEPATQDYADMLAEAIINATAEDTKPGSVLTVKPVAIGGNHDQ